MNITFNYQAIIKTTIVCILLTIVFPISASAQLESVKELSMKSAYFNHERQVLIYTPDGYQQFDQTYYDVIYVFDAQDRTKFDLVHCLLNIACKRDPDDGRSMDFIIVGICSPSLPDINYYRNNDYLPMPLHGNKGLFKEGRGYGNSPDLKKFVKHELMPYMAKNYRTSGRSLGIGHSLSASFVLDAMMTDDLFDDYIAVSPNCCYDEFHLAADIERYPFKNHKMPRFIYASMANETEKEPEYWGDDWKAGWERVSTFLKDGAHFSESTVTSVKTFPDYGHYTSFMPSLTAALNDYIVFGAKNLVGYIGEETHPVHIELRGKNLPADIYITGNQDALANWEAKGHQDASRQRQHSRHRPPSASARPIQVHPWQLGARGSHRECRTGQPHHTRCPTCHPRVSPVGERSLVGRGAVTSE